MTTQTYCTRLEIEAKMGPAALLASIDDDADGVTSAEDEAIIDYVIEQAASEINQCVRHQYHPLSSLADNIWLKWANATIAEYKLRIRRNNPAEASVETDYREIKRVLNEIRWGREQLPDQAPSFDHLPSVSTFNPQLYRNVQPIRVNRDESTTSEPVGNRKRRSDDEVGYNL